MTTHPAKGVRQQYRGRWPRWVSAIFCVCDSIEGVQSFKSRPSPPSHHGGGGGGALGDQADELELKTNDGNFLIPGTMEGVYLIKCREIDHIVLALRHQEGNLTYIMEFSSRLTY